MYIVACVVVFAAAYLLNIVTITVGYHRGLAHKAVTLSPRVRRAVVVAGNWITGLDPKAWVVMHRLHHEHSDTPDDPHSPLNVGVLGIAREQLKSYERVIVGLARNDPKYTRYATDLEFPISALNLRGLWWAPYALHAAVGVVVAVVVGPLLGFAYFAGMMSHPVQGGLVNAFGHALGGRNFDTDDNARNNHLVAWLVLGEGFQNNHHHAPASARFSCKPLEVDLGYGACLALEAVGALEIQRASLLPRWARGAPLTSDCSPEHGQLQALKAE
jgi:stearoyl-CoA desaturase (delta-9 desaturase)